MSKEERKVPELRFKGFHDDWEQRKLGDVSSFFNSERIPIDASLRKKGQYPYYGATGIIDYIDSYIFEGEYVLLAEDGANILTRNSPVAYITNGKFWLNNHAHIMKMNNNNNFFLLELLEKQDYTKYNSGTAQPKLNNNIIRNLPLYLPKDVEQFKIGRLLKKINTTIELHQRILNIKKQLYRQHLTMLVPVNSFTSAKIKIPNSPEEWSIYKIKELFTITRGNVLSRNKVASERSSLYPYPVYSSQTSNNGLLGYYSQYLFENAITWTTDGANAGTVNYRKEKFYSTNVNGVLLSKGTSTNKFIAESLNRVAWKHVSRVGNPKLMNNIMGNIKIMLPIKHEQIILSKLLESFDEQINLYQKKLDILHKIKSVYLRKMFL